MSTPETQTASAPALEEPELRKALSSTRPKKAGALSATLTFGWRGMLKVKHVPEQLIDVTITPVMFTVSGMRRKPASARRSMPPRRRCAP